MSEGITPAQTEAQNPNNENKPAVTPSDEQSKQQTKDLADNLRKQAAINPHPEVGLRTIAGETQDTGNQNPQENTVDEAPLPQLNPKAVAEAERFKQKLVDIDALQEESPESSEQRTRGTDDRLWELVGTLSDSEYFDGNNKITDEELRELMTYLHTRAADRRQNLEMQKDGPPIHIPESPDDWKNQSSIPLAGERRDADLDMWERVMDMTDGDPSVVPPHIQKEIVARMERRNAALKSRTSPVPHEPSEAERSQGESVRTTNEQQSEGPSIEENVQERINNSTQELLHKLRLHGLTLGDLQGNPELFRIDPHDMELLESLDQETKDALSAPIEDTFVRGVGEKLLANAETHAGYASILSSIHLLAESTATGLRAQQYLEQLGPDSTESGVGEAIQRDLAALGDVQGDTSVLEQQRVTVGGMTLNPIEASNLLNFLQANLPAAHSSSVA